MKNRIVFASIALALAAAVPVHAGVERSGTTAANFLTVGAGSRALGMGGTSLGLAGDLSSVIWNAGALAALNGTEIQLAHAETGGETVQEWAAAGGKLPAFGTRWALSGLYQREGTFEGRDASNVSTGSFDIASVAFGATLAQPIARVGSVGIGAKWVNQQLGPAARGAGLAFDAGVQARVTMVGLELGAGAAAQNALGSIRFGAQHYPLPTNYGVGVGVAHLASGVSVGLDLNVPVAYYPDVRGGVEWRWRDRLAIRGGYRAELASEDPLTGPTFGLGAGAAGLWFDYGYIMSGVTGEGQHRMGLSLKPGRMGMSGVYGPAPERIETTPKTSEQPAPKR